MKPFTFRLDVLLRLRESEKSECLSRLQKVHSQISLLQEKNLKTANDIGSVYSFRKIEVMQAQNMIAHKFALETAHLKTEEDIMNLEESVTEIKSELVDIQRNIKVLESLKQKKKEEHLYELKREEQAFLDEVGSRRYGENELES